MGDGSAYDTGSDEIVQAGKGRAMGKLEMIRSLFGYNEWATDKILETASKLSPEELSRKSDLSPKGVTDTLAHAVGTQIFWLGEWKEPGSFSQSWFQGLDSFEGVRVGFGKSHQALVQYLASLGGRHVITVEDPVEQIIPGIMQTEVSEARGLTFAKAARHLLRQDPQVLVIGEIRDEETAHIAVRAGLTGHLVIATLHAGSCQGVFERLLVICSDRHGAMTAVELVLNQRLIRRLCQECRGQGCRACLQTGYRGRAPLVEWLRADETLRRQLRAENLEAVQLKQTLETSARELLSRGLSDEKELSRVLGS
jgi:hypothetical protein